MLTLPVNYYTSHGSPSSQFSDVVTAIAITTPVFRTTILSYTFINAIAHPTEPMVTNSSTLDCFLSEVSVMGLRTQHNQNGDVYILSEDSKINFGYVCCSDPIRKVQYSPPWLHISPHGDRSIRNKIMAISSRLGIRIYQNTEDDHSI